MLPVQSCHSLYFSRPVADRRCATPLPPTGFSPHPYSSCRVYLHSLKRAYCAVPTTAGVPDFAICMHGLNEGHAGLLRQDRQQDQRDQTGVDIAGLKIIVGSGTNQEKVLLVWNEANEKAGIKPALLQYFDDQAAAQLAIRSGRSDALFGPNSVYAYSAAITGGIKRVGTVNGGWPLQADIAVTTRKDNGLVKPIHTALEGAIAGGQYEQVLQRWGLDVERVDTSLINPPGLPD